MGVSRHWTWSGAEPLVSGVAQIGLAVTSSVGRAKIPALQLFYISTDNELFSARQRNASDSTTWEVQPELSSNPPTSLHGYVYARQFSVGGQDLFVLDKGFATTRYRQTNLGAPWLKVTDPQLGQNVEPFEGEKVRQMDAAVDPYGLTHVVAIRQDGLVVWQRESQTVAFGWDALYIGSHSAFLVEIAANPNNGGLLEIFFIDNHKVLWRMPQLPPLPTNPSTWPNQWGPPEMMLTDNPQIYGFVVGQNADGRLEIFGTDLKSNIFHAWQTSTTDTTQWSPWTPFPGASKAKQITVTSNQDGRLETFYVGTDGSLYHNWQARPNHGWVGETLIPGITGKQVAVARNGSGQLELFWIDEKNVVQHSIQNVPNAGWVDTNGQGPNAPSSSLGSNSNLILRSEECGLLTDVAITISITEDLTYSENGPGQIGSQVNGFSFQLNCAGRNGDFAIIQQYSFGFDGKHISCQINNWTTDPANTNFGGVDAIVNERQNLVALSGKMISAGYQLIISLNNDGLGNILSSTFTVVSPNGEIAARKTLDINGHVLSENASHGTPVAFDKKSSIVGPIVAMQLNLVGPANGETVTFTSGAGTIDYLASSLLAANEAFPNCVQFGGGDTITEETGNSSYGSMSAAPSNFLQQTFSISSGGQPLILKDARLRPPTPSA